MAASNDNGEFQHWWTGFPINGLKKGTLDSGTMQYWFGGFPMPELFPAAAPAGGNIKTINGVLNANIKTWNGIAIANIKTLNGVSNV